MLPLHGLFASVSCKGFGLLVVQWVVVLILHGGPIELFHDALNTLYLWLYGIRDMVKDHSDSERGNALPPHGLLFPTRTRFFLYAPPNRQKTHTMAFLTPVMEHWLERETIQWVPHEGLIRRPITL